MTFSLDTQMMAMARHELLAVLRTSRTFLLTCLAMGLAIVVVSFSLPEELTPMNAGAAARQLFVSYACFIFGAAVLFMPALAAVTITVERRQGTFDLLRLTPLKPRHIVLGKVLHTFGFYLLLLIATLPIIGVLFFLIGVEWAQFIQAVVTSLLTALSASIIGVGCSARFSGRTSAIAASYLGLLVVMGPPQILVLGIASFGLLVPVLGVLYYFLSPAAALVHTFLSSNWIVFAASAAYQGVIIVVSFHNACRLTARPPVSYDREAHAVPRLTPVPPDPEAPPEFTPEPPAPVPDIPGVAAKLGGGNVIVRIRARWYDWQVPFTLELYVFCVVVALTASIVALDMFEGAQLGLTWLMFEVVLLLIVTPGVVSTRFTREYEQHTMDSLRMTPMRPHGLVLHQLSKAALKLAPLVIGMLASALPLAFTNSPWRLPFSVVLRGQVSLLVCFFLALSVSQLMGLQTRKTPMALLMGHFGNLTVFLGVMAVAILTFEGRRWLDPALTRNLFSLLSPLRAFEFELNPRYVLEGTWAWSTVWLLTTLIYTTLFLVCVALSIHYFKRLHVRDR